MRKFFRNFGESFRNAVNYLCMALVIPGIRAITAYIWTMPLED